MKRGAQESTTTRHPEEPGSGDVGIHYFSQHNRYYPYLGYFLNGSRRAYALPMTLSEIDEGKVLSVLGFFDWGKK